MSEEAAAAAANRNFVGSYRALCRHVDGAYWQEFGGAFAFATGLPMGLFNGCVITAPARPQDLAEAIAWVQSQEVPFRVWVDEARAPGLGDVPTRHGLERAQEPYPAMVLRAPFDDPPPWPQGVRVVPVGEAELPRYHQVWLAGGGDLAVIERLFPRSLPGDAGIELFLAEYEGEPAGASLALRTGGVSGVYAVSTVDRFRRRGIGGAATWAAVQAGRAWDCHTVVLQSTPMGFSLYRRMGFEVVGGYAEFRAA